MEVHKATPKSNELQQMPYSELKKLAKKHGIKGNMKAEKIISALCSLDSDDLESFSTPLQKEINSSRKNKEKKFDEDATTPLATPRRGTYSVESPTSVKDEDASFMSAAGDTSALDMSNVTIDRGSERKLRRKVSFLNPMEELSTPKNSSIKLRPKTPVASRTPLSKRVSFSSPFGERKIKSTERSLQLTPHPRKSHTPRQRNSINEENFALNAVTPKENIVLPSVAELPEKQDITPGVKQSENDSKSISNKDDAPEINVAASATKLPERKHITRSVKQSQNHANKSSSVASGVFINETSAKKKRGATPNFKKIHEKAFQKMESIDDYQRRKAQNSEKKINHWPDMKSKVTKAKSKIPAYSGIPFIPSVSSNACKALNFDSKTKNGDSFVETKTKNAKNVQKKDKTKFDLKKSLSRKLGYVPYKGPLKPLAESNLLNTTSASCFHNQKEPINKVVSSNRLQTRSVLKGVRINKRFELQMKNRNLE